MFRLVLVLLAFGALPVLAAETPLPACDAPIDLRDAGESMDGLTPSTQGYHPTNLCGFFTFSNYLDSYRISRNGERGGSIVRSSPIAIGVENAIRKNIPFWFPVQNSTDPLSLRFGRWGSTFCALANAVKEIGYCVDSRLPTGNPDETAKFADVTTYFYGELMKIADTLPAFRSRAIDARIGGLYAKYFEWASERKNVAFDQERVRALIEANPTKPYETVRAVFLADCVKDAKRRRDLDFASCESDLYVGLDALGFPTRDRDPWRSERALRRVVELLSRPHALPVPFAYCSAVLKEGKRYEGKSPIQPTCGIHWSLIAGRRRIGKDCYLLVHNSWQPNATYSKDWMVDRGDIWVRETELTRAMLVAQWLDD